MNYAPGWVMFEFQKGSVISDIIAGIERVGTLDFKPGWVPSHTWLVLDETTGIEAATEGVARFPLSKYFDNPECQLMACRPAELSPVSLDQIRVVANKLTNEDLGYDYSGLVGDALEVFTFADQIIPDLKRIANPLHDGHDLFCSALVSTILEATQQYRGQELFRENTVSKISPLMLFTGFPWDKKQGRERLL